MSEIGSKDATTGLGSVIRAVLAAHGAAGENEGLHFLIEGPGITCSYRATNGIALILHELATNASKYGALTDHAGAVAVSWKKHDANVLTWKESGGPIISGPRVKSVSEIRLLSEPLRVSFAALCNVNGDLRGS